jgi:hypothetical protein
VNNIGASRASTAEPGDSEGGLRFPKASEWAHDVSSVLAVLVNEMWDVL